MLSLGRDFLIRMLINRNAPSIVVHIFFSRWELPPLEFQRGLPLLTC
jgi:hypothetical protein